MKNCIITPTFVDHFKYIKDYLDSFSKLAIDKDNFEICFTISKFEENIFNKIVDPFPDLNIKILIFEDILNHFKIKYTPDELLNKYDKFSFQTLKKFYTMLYLGENYRFLVLDSESIMLNKSSIGNLFDNFFMQPFISYSDIKQRLKTNKFIYDVKVNTAFALQSANISNLWFLENFVWFYDYRILTDLFDKYGTPFDIINNVYNNAFGKRNTAVFEIDLYQSFIYLHHTKYKYNIINVDDILNNIYNNENYKHNLARKFNGGFGILENAMQLLNKNNLLHLAMVFKNNKFNIIRCEGTTGKNYRLQQRFLNIVQPIILASSQNHFFGIKHNLKQFITISLNCKYKYKIIFHFKAFIVPISKLLYWLFQPIHIICNIYKFFINLLINIFGLHI